MLRKDLNFMRMTLSSLLKQGVIELKEAGIEDADWDAWCLFEYVTGISRTEYFCDRERLCEGMQVKRYQELIGRRAAHVPLQYLTGEQVFMGLPFWVNASVLIPRQDTEVLVEEVRKYLKPGKRVLDMCTGSGCILLSLVYFCAPKYAVGADLSKEALEVARENENRLYQKGFLKRGGRQDVVQSDLTEQTETIEWIGTDMFEQIRGNFDCIVSNPPYIASAVIETLAEEVKEYEPVLALDGREDGLFFYRILAEEAGNYLNPGGMLFLEIGYDQGEAVAALLENAGFFEVQVKKDLAGLDRVCFGIWKEREEKKGSAEHV